MFTLTNSINFAQPFVEYTPLNAGLGYEPTTSICTMIRATLLSAPMSWIWNRNEITFTTTVGTQDYSQSISANGNDFGFIEKVSLSDDAGNIWEVKDVYNNQSLAKSSFQQRPSAVSAESISVSAGVQTVKFRFLGVPDAVYTVTVIYQKLAPLFGPFVITAAGNASAGSTIYTGIFDPYSQPVGSTAIITGFPTAYNVNNGTFTVSAITTTSMTVNNASGIAVSSGIPNAVAINPSWAPIPDQYVDIYNYLYLSEILAVDDDARAQVYRQRGIASFLAKSAGLSETQRNVFVQQWMARGFERSYFTQITQAGAQGRSL